MRKNVAIASIHSLVSKIWKFGKKSILCCYKKGKEIDAWFVLFLNAKSYRFHKHSSVIYGHCNKNIVGSK